LAVQVGTHDDPSAVDLQPEVELVLAQTLVEGPERGELDEPQGTVERPVPRHVAVRAQRELSVSSGPSLTHRGAHEGRSSPASLLVREDGDLLEVGVPLELENVGKAHRRVTGDEQEPWLRGTLGSRRSGTEQCGDDGVAEQLMELRTTALLDPGDVAQVRGPRWTDGRRVVSAARAHRTSLGQVRKARLVDSPLVRLVVARCQVDYAGRLTAHLPMATRVLMIKADGSVLIHSDGGSYKPLNWMSPPCSVREGTNDAGQVEWVVTGKSDDTLRILIDDVQHDSLHDLGIDPGLQKDGVEKHLQELLAAHPATLSEGLTLVRREFPTAIGPVDLMCRDAEGVSVAVEIKRRGEIDGVEQLTRYLELLNRDPLLAPVRGIFAAQEIKPQARVLASDRGISCAVVDYDALRGLDDPSHRLF
jgi:RecB family endonuclease NucS